MKIVLRMPQVLLTRIHGDLSRPHAFAAERVGFLACGAASLGDGDVLLLGDTYHPIDDAHYIDNPKVGAMIGSGAFRAALQIAYGSNVAMFHVHRHEHVGKPRFSPIDLRESARFVPDFFKVRPAMLHGVLVLSHDSISGLCWLPGYVLVLSHDSISGLCWLPGGTTRQPIDEFTIVGQRGVRAIA